MIWIAALLALGQAGEPDCDRYRQGSDLQPCEFVRDSQADILDAVRRPPAGNLGQDVIRFSRRPELGGRGAVVEIIRRDRGRADVRLWVLSGHPRTRWELADTAHFMLSANEYGQLKSGIDAAISRYRMPEVNPDNGERIICLDGPGFLTERVKAGRIASLAGQCPPAIDEEHPNRNIADLVDAMLCRHLGTLRNAPLTDRRCAPRSSS